MLIIKDISHLKLYLKAYQEKGYSIGYVPTMGALHQGHGKLFKQSQNDNQKTVISIFVNEKQFNKKEDFDKYPRNKGRDYDFCESHNVDVIFEPSSEEIYPDDKPILKNKYFQNILCDRFRPGHFDGVTTVLNEFFSIVHANKVYFGQKDYQQLKIVEKFIEEKFTNLKIISIPTERQEEGIAYSSRNENLSKKQLQEFIDFHSSAIQFTKSFDKKIALFIEKPKKFYRRTVLMKDLEIEIKISKQRKLETLELINQTIQDIEKLIDKQNLKD